MCFWLVSVHCVCAFFDLRYPGVHQSSSGSGEHQRGGCWTLPRHEWERRALWVGESKKKKTPFIHNRSPVMQTRVSFTSLALDTSDLFYWIHYFTAVLEKPSFSLYNMHQNCVLSKNVRRNHKRQLESRFPNADKKTTVRQNKYVFLFTEPHIPWKNSLSSAT